MHKGRQKVSGLTYRCLALKGDDGAYNANNGIYLDQYQGCLGPSTAQAFPIHQLLKEKQFRSK